MEKETFRNVVKLFHKIDIGDEPGSEKNDIYAQDYNDTIKPQPTLKYVPKPYVDFKQYIKDKCENKIKILNRETFNYIKRPIVICFNHFREMCNYHTYWLDIMYKVALKYGDQIEFIAADMLDIDVMYPGINALNFFCRLINPEREYPHTYVIDKTKRVYEHIDDYKKLENLLGVCEDLLKGNLFLSLPIPDNNEGKLVKICVHNNYEELVLNSTKNIFLIINIEQCQKFDEQIYENVALALKDTNLDIAYMEAEENYVPFEYRAYCYPTFVYIPCNDKKNFVYYEGLTEENAIITYLTNIMNSSDYLQLQQKELRSELYQKIVEVPKDFEIDFYYLPSFFEENFESRFEILDHKVPEISHRYFFIIFMDFPNMKCTPTHVKWFNKLYQFVQKSYSHQFFVADFIDIDIINTKWSPLDIKNAARGKPRIYVIDDKLKHSYEFGNFDSGAALYYFAERLRSRQLYYSQVYSRKNLNEAVREWTADYFYIFLQNCKKNIFITFYSSTDKKCKTILTLLDKIAEEVHNLDIEIAKFDVELNYVDLEYACKSYPIHYFIPKYNKPFNIPYIDKSLKKNKMLKFIQNNLKLTEERIVQRK